MELGHSVHCTYIYTPGRPGRGSHEVGFVLSLPGHSIHTSRPSNMKTFKKSGEKPEGCRIQKQFKRTQYLDQGQLREVTGHPS